MQKQQPGSNDCGVYAIANATTIAFRGNPSLVKYDQSAVSFYRMFNFKALSKHRALSKHFLYNNSRSCT